MHVDYYLPPDTPLAAVADEARRISEIGYDGFFTAETAHDPFIPLAMASVAAPRLTLGTAIAVAFPRSPMVTAQVAWDLARLSDGRFILGLGTQVKPHIVRRFGMEWTTATARMRDYIDALRAIWESFQTGSALRFESDEYRLSLITPFFNPGPIDHPEVPVAIAGVGPGLSHLAGERCQGFHVHPFHTVKYLDEVVIPNVAAGAESTGRDPGDVELISTVFVITGRDEAEMAKAMAAAKQQISFYASTPSYRVVLETHGWDFGDELNRMSRRGEWDRMADVVPDEVVSTIGVVAEPDRVGEAIKERYQGRIGRIGYYTLDGAPQLSDDELAAMVAATG
ncbi:MAG: TIGR03617 family F420-dependent LLM class oxidoreductase [Acidimicrobiia bacterium]|nr:TIGR03617 family F420-dependent LLM class oxidoreductase [Acidimicrobiia bacterium]